MGDKNGFTPRNRGGFRGRNGYDNRSNPRNSRGPRGRGGARGRGGMRGRGAPRLHGAPRGGPPASNAVNRETTVLVKNLPSHAADWQTKLTALFKDCGPVEKMEFVKNGPRDEGVFTFSQEDSVEKALQVHGSLLEGRHVIVDLPEKNDLKFEPTSCKVDAGADVIEEDIWGLLEGCGAIKAIRLKHDSRKAHVLFETEEAVQAALNLNGSELNGAPCSILRWRSWRSCQEQSLGVAVFGLLHRVSRDDVTEYFKECGNICSVWVEFPRDSSIRRALLVFEEEEGARKALEKDGTLLGKDTIRVRPWDGRKFINAVFIGGVPFGLAPTDLWKVFQTCGTIDNVHFDRFNQSYAARRACVEFEDAASVKNALALDGIEIKGKRIKVFHSLDEWDQHLADYKEAREKAREGAEEVKEEPEGDVEGEADGEAENEAEAEAEAEGEGEGEGEAEAEGAEADGELDGEQQGNGEAEVSVKTEVKEEPAEQVVDNGIKTENKGPGKRKAYQGAQARNKARKLR